MLRADAPQDQTTLVAQAKELLATERDFIANAGNISAFIFMFVPGLNWAGVYIARGSELVLGPFQGKPACTRIPLGKGVCGTAATKRETIVVLDVNEFAGHIACDTASQSEIVIPLVRAGQLIGVLDVDSPTKGRFSEDDRALFEALAEVLVAASDV
ncbi:MAG: GAF domain-containing protein [Vulcanimicrobiaceae bacterium]